MRLPTWLRRASSESEPMPTVSELLEDPQARADRLVAEAVGLLNESGVSYVVATADEEGVARFGCGPWPTTLGLAHTLVLWLEGR